jgi:hypothetical protein
VLWWRGVRSKTWEWRGSIFRNRRPYAREWTLPGLGAIPTGLVGITLPLHASEHIGQHPHRPEWTDGRSPPRRTELRGSTRRQFSADVADRAVTETDQVFTNLPPDKGHFSEPYVRHILRGLPSWPPTYVQDILAGQPPSPTLADTIGGIVIVRC